MDNKCTLYNYIVLAICVPKINNFGEDLTKVSQKQVGSFLAQPESLHLIDYVMT